MSNHATRRISAGPRPRRLRAAYRHGISEGLPSVQDGLDGLLPKDPDFPATIQDAATGEPKAFEDTPFNRAWHAVGKHFDDIAKRISFQYRVLHLMPMVMKDRKYAKYVVNKKPHIALLAAMAAVPFSSRTTPKALRAAFDREFRQRLASTVNADQDSDDATRQ